MLDIPSPPNDLRIAEHIIVIFEFRILVHFDQRAAELVVAIITNVDKCAAEIVVAISTMLWFTHVSIVQHSRCV